MRSSLLAIATCAASLLAAGCGSSAHHAATHPLITDSAPTTTPRHAPLVPQSIPDPPPTGKAPSPSAITVIKGWSNALRAGDIDAAAAYFAVPSAFVNGIGSGGALEAVVIHSAAESRQVNESLPCGATFVSADQRGRYVNVLFRLGGRKGPGGGNCGGETGEARTNFVISGGKIVDWIRAPADPGDNGGAGTGTGTGTAPTPTVTSGQGTPVV